MRDEQYDGVTGFMRQFTNDMATPGYHNVSSQELVLFAAQRARDMKLENKTRGKYSIAIDGLKDIHDNPSQISSVRDNVISKHQKDLPLIEGDEDIDPV